VIDGETRECHCAWSITTNLQGMGFSVFAYLKLQLLEFLPNIKTVCRML